MGATVVRSGRFPRSARLAVLATVLAGACGRPGAPARIVYPYPWLGGALARVAQPAIDAWGTPRAELPESLMQAVVPTEGYAGEIEYARAMAAVPGLAAAIGPMSSRATLLAAPVYRERGIPLIVPTATSDRVSVLGPGVFQLAPSDSAEGAFVAGFLVDHLAARRITIFYLDDDEYGIDLRRGVARALRARGLEPADEVGFIVGADLRRRVAESLRRAMPDAVVVAARSPEALGIVRALHERVPNTPVVLGDGTPLNDSFVQSTGPAAAAVYGVAWWSADAADSIARDFAERYRRATGQTPVPSQAMYYDAIMVAARAAHEAGPSPAAVRRWLGELGRKRPPYRGVTGPISFAPDRRSNLLMTHPAAGGAVVVVGREGGS